MNGTETASRAMSALQAIPAADIASTLARIAEAMEKQNELTEKLTDAIEFAANSIFCVGSHL